MKHSQNEKKKSENFRKAWAKIISMAWADETFKKRLLKHTEEVLKEYGIPMQKGMKYRIHENTEKEHHLVLPEKKFELSVEQIQSAIAGATGVPTQQATRNF